MDYRDLPYDAEIEYLESTGTQWIDTNYTLLGSDSVNVEMKVMQTQATTKICFYFCQAFQSNHRFAAYSNGSNKYASVYRTYWVASNTSTDTNIHTLIWNNGKFYRDGTLLCTASSSIISAPDGTLTINSYGNGSINNCRYYYIKITKNNELIFDFIPVRVGNVGYLFDKVSGQLFGNAGTGSFILGPDVAPGRYANEIAFLESTGSQYIDTGIVPTDNIKVALNANYTYTDVSYLFGCISTDYRTNCFALSGNKDLVNPEYFRCFVSGDSISVTAGNVMAKDTPELHSCVLDKNHLEIDGVEYPFTYAASLPLNISHSIYLYARNNIGTADYLTSMKVYGFKIWQNDTLVRDYIPVEYNNIGYLYDKVSGEFFANQGTGKFVLGHRAPRFDGKACARSYTRRQLMAENYVGKAPRGYKWVDYIQNTSSAYINTGCYADGTTKVEMVMENVANTSFRGIIGTRRSGNPTWGLDQHASAGTTAYFNYGNTYSGVGTIAIGSKTTILINANVLKRNGTTYTLSGTWSGGALSNPIYVFREYSGATSCALMKLYSLKITIGGVLLRDYVPIKRLSDNKYGLWDKVNKNFVTSASSSNFTGGND